MLGNRRVYTGGVHGVKSLGLYAAEDDLDQHLCNLGKLCNIDVIILTDMVGSHQIVTEVLDTRPRNVSFGSLKYS